MPNAFFCKNVCQHRIKLPQRGERAALGRIGFIAEPSLEDILSSDGEARTLVKERYS